MSQINTYFQLDLVQSIQKYVNITIREWEILWLFHKNPFLTFSIRDIFYSPIHFRLSASSRQGKGIAWQWGFWNPKKRLSLLNYQLFPFECKHAIWSNSFSFFRKAPCVTLQVVICNMAGCYQAATIFYLCSIKSSIILRFIHSKTFHGRHTPIPVHVYHGEFADEGEWGGCTEQLSSCISNLVQSHMSNLCYKTKVTKGHLPLQQSQTWV